MLTRAQEKRIKSLQNAKGREESGTCLVEGQKVIDTAGSAVEFTFDRNDTGEFDDLVTTETPQEIAGVATIPSWTLEQIKSKKTIVVLDGVQDPGNVGAILRLCLGFDTSLILIESADVTSPKVIRASVGAMFQVPWQKISRVDAHDLIVDLQFPIFRLEKNANAKDLPAFTEPQNAILIAGSEGNGIQLPIEAPSISIDHNTALESLNVGHALAIALHARYES
ncbi:MAG: TrmH family RNA methyltransferase [Patescibacteria group bacterium]|jgi:TrmH family RNA methyltransferase